MEQARSLGIHRAVVRKHRRVPAGVEGTGDRDPPARGQRLHRDRAVCRGIPRVDPPIALPIHPPSTESLGCLADLLRRRARLGRRGDGRARGHASRRDPRAGGVFRRPRGVRRAPAARTRFPRAVLPDPGARRDPARDRRAAAAAGGDRDPRRPVARRSSERARGNPDPHRPEGDPRRRGMRWHAHGLRACAHLLRVRVQHSASHAGARHPPPGKSVRRASLQHGAARRDGLCVRLLDHAIRRGDARRGRLADAASRDRASAGNREVHALARSARIHTWRFLQA